jgi:hypothetical protein
MGHFLKKPTNFLKAFLLVLHITENSFISLSRKLTQAQLTCDLLTNVSSSAIACFPHPSEKKVKSNNMKMENGKLFSHFTEQTVFLKGKKEK